jgi:hypothetical protein
MAELRGRPGHLCGRALPNITGGEGDKSDFLDAFRVADSSASPASAKVEGPHSSPS